MEDGTASLSKNMSHDDDVGAVDFRKLEKDLDTAVAADAKYWRENDAKFRAVHQKVASYEEFRDIVLASNLKPLDKDDRLTNIVFTQPWNSQATKKENTADKPETADIPKGKKYPTSGQAFIREWRKLNKNTGHQYSYLLELGGERLGNIFKLEIGFGLLGEFAHCLNCELNVKEDGEVLTILEKLGETERFKLTVDFLSKKERVDVGELFTKLRHFVKEESDDDNIKLNMLEAVEQVYGLRQSV